MLKGLAMKYLLAAVALLAASIGVARAAGMSQEQYYVGSWSCMVGEPGHKPSKASVNYTMDAGMLRMWVLLPVQAGVKRQYAFSQTTIYDAKAGHFVQSGLDTDGGYSVSTAQPWNGNTESWVDRVNSTGKLGRGTTVRTNHNSFSFKGYETTTSSKPNFEGTCTRT